MVFAPVLRDLCVARSSTDREASGGPCTILRGGATRRHNIGWSCARAFAAAFFVIAAFSFGAAAGAQTAHFSGAVLALAPSELSYPYGVAVDSAGDVFVADTGSSTVKEVLAAGGYTTINTLGSGFNNPSGVAVDGSGNVFIADNGNHAVKEILAAGGYTTVRTLGGGFYYPTNVAVDRSGNVFVADTGNNAVKEIKATGG